MASVVTELVESLTLDGLYNLQDMLSKAAALTPENYRTKFDNLAVNTEDAFTNLANQLATGRTSPNLFRDRLFRVLRRSMADAYRFGLGASGNRPILFQPDLDTIRGYLRDDDTYLSGFSREVISGEVPGLPFSKPNAKGRFSVHDRVILYSNALRALFFAGYVSRASNTTSYVWLLGPTEHCVNCVDMEADSPYTMATLAGRMPGADVCLGLDRCGCSIIESNN